MFLLAGWRVCLRPRVHEYLQRCSVTPARCIVPVWQGNSFGTASLKGNPAAMVYNPEVLTPDAAAAFIQRRDYSGADAVLAAVAAEKNLAETAFVAPVEDGTYVLRWFTPGSEVRVEQLAVEAARRVAPTCSCRRSTLE